MASDDSLDDQLTYRPLETRDLELLLAWRSNPLIYENLREQTGPLAWSDHLSWFEDRPDGRHDYVILFEGRRIGSVSLSEDSHVGVFVGEIDLWGRGIGSHGVNWICHRHPRNEYFAEIHRENTASIRLFESCEFSQHEASDGWLTYRRGTPEGRVTK